MRIALILLLIVTIFIPGLTQNNKNVFDKPSIKIHCATPTFVSLGQSIKLKVRVSHNLQQEKTGQLTLAIINQQTKKSVDGWFVNIFPFQYFTTILNEPFETEFPFTVPFDYLGKFELEIVARVNQISDSVHFTIPTRKVK
ncbi:MAG: hypothetical protein ACR2IM_04930 [Sediminibacterium sp.]|jgi:hypothetical protein